MLGKALSVYWPADKAWYRGTITDHNPSNGQHLVKYDDGEEEWVLLAHERVRWEKDQPDNGTSVFLSVDINTPTPMPGAAKAPAPARKRLRKAVVEPDVGSSDEGSGDDGSDWEAEAKVRKLMQGRCTAMHSAGAVLYTACHRGRRLPWRRTTMTTMRTWCLNTMTRNPPAKTTTKPRPPPRAASDHPPPRRRPKSGPRSRAAAARGHRGQPVAPGTQ